MGISRGNITTNIIKKGLVFNMDAANRASTIPNTSTLKTFNTIDLSQSGSIVTDATWEAGSPPTFDFDGTDGKIETNFTANGFSGLTVSAWIYRINNQTQYFADQWIEGGGTSSSWGLSTYNNKLLFFIRAGSSTKTVTGGTNVATGVWRNVTGIWDGSNIYVYLNSISDATPVSCTSMNTTTPNMSIASSTNDQYFLNGNIGCVHVYNRALSASEVLFNYNGLKSRFGL